jgi:outer membrane lipoprotein carrier protein
MHTFLVVVSLIVAAAAPALARASARRASADEVARALQKKYDAIRAFSAQFTHTYTGGVLRKSVTERGEVVIKKPGLMRWTYTAPDQKVFVADGVKVYSYVPADRQVVVSSMPTGDEASTPILFLAGKGNLSRDFSVSFADSADIPKPLATPGVHALKLVPRKKAPEYDWLVLIIDRASLQLRGLVTRDQQGGTSAFLFTNLKENVAPADKTFTFRIPRGVDVIHAGNAR